MQLLSLNNSLLLECKGVISVLGSRKYSCILNLSVMFQNQILLLIASSVFIASTAEQFPLSSPRTVHFPRSPCFTLTLTNLGL
jgi:hypothetical protein